MTPIDRQYAPAARPRAWARLPDGLLTHCPLRYPAMPSGRSLLTRPVRSARLWHSENGGGPGRRSRRVDGGLGHCIDWLHVCRRFPWVWRWAP